MQQIGSTLITPCKKLLARPKVIWQIQMHFNRQTTLKIHCFSLFKCCLDKNYVIKTLIPNLTSFIKSLYSTSDRQKPSVWEHDMLIEGKCHLTTKPGHYHRSMRWRKTSLYTALGCPWQRLVIEERETGTWLCRYYFPALVQISSFTHLTRVIQKHINLSHHFCMQWINFFSHFRFFL